MGITAGDLTQASEGIQELVDSIVWHHNRHQGAPRWVVSAFIDWTAMLWRVGFREEEAKLDTTVWLVIPDEYGCSPSYYPDLRFDDLMDAIRDRWKAGGQLALTDFIIIKEAPVADLGFQPTLHPRINTMPNAPRALQVGDVVRIDGREMRVLTVDGDGRKATLVPIENTVDPEVVQRERAVREAQESEARAIMLEALRRTTD